MHGVMPVVGPDPAADHRGARRVSIAAFLALSIVCACTTGPARTTPTRAPSVRRATPPPSSPTRRLEEVVLTADLSEAPAPWHLVATIPFGRSVEELGLLTDVRHTAVPLLPRSFAIAPDGSIWILDVLKHRLAHYTSAGAYIGQIGGFKFDRFSPHPRDVLFSNGRMYVLEDKGVLATLVTVAPNGSLHRVQPVDQGKAVVLELLYPSATGVAALLDGWADQAGAGPRGIAMFDPPGSTSAQFLPGVPLWDGGWIALDAPSDQDIDLTFTKAAAPVAVQPVHLKIVTGRGGGTKELGAVAGPTIEGAATDRVAIHVRISPAQPDDAERYGGGSWLLGIGTRGPIVWERLPTGDVSNEEQARHLAVGPDGRLYLAVPTKEGERIYGR
jgi:hypothetical protein